MKLLISKALLIDPTSIHHNTTKDILIIDGIIKGIDNNIDAADAQVIEGNVVSPGFIDVFSHFCDPGFEHRETLESGANAAAAGGYTTVFALPDAKPITDTKSQVEYINARQRDLAVTILPLGAVSNNQEGKQLAEMYDMHNSGAIAFTDGLKPIQSAGLMLKALQYVKTINGVLITLPVDKTIAPHALMHEGIISTQLGLPGMPHIAEEIFIKRDIDLLEYTESKLHITGISSAKSVELIAAAKARGLQISCSVTPYHLLFCDEDLQDYDTNLKVNPPLRTRDDMEALRQGVLNGTVDCIASHHLPQHLDNKDCEFEYAKNGMTSLETAFSMVCMALPQLTYNKIVELFSTNAATIFGLQQQQISIGATACLTIFNPTQKWIYTKEIVKSKSFNSPLINKNLTGGITGIVNKAQVIVNNKTN